MKNAFRLFLLLAQFTAARALQAEDTAYTALRAVGKQNGKDTLNRVVDVRGRAGAPSPDVWKITLNDPAARGGIRELEVQHGRIVADRSPLGRLLSAPMNFNSLNLDSDGVFTIANDEAKKAGISFDHVDYTLRGGSHSAAPVWVVDLYDGRNGRVATIEIGADNGAIVRRDVIPSNAPAAPLPPPPAHRPTGHDAPPPPPAAGPAAPDPAVIAVSGFFDRMKRHIVHHFEKRRRQFENFFSGKSWSTDDPEREADRDERDFNREIDRDQKGDRDFEKDFDRDSDRN